MRFSISLRQSSRLALIPLAFFLALQNVVAGSATWSLNPVNGDWNQAIDWTPPQIPNGPSDVATFGVSNVTNLSVGKTATEVNSIVFNPGASAFTTTLAFPAASFTISGVGVINNSGTMQNFVNPTSASSSITATTTFTGNAKAGSQTSFINQGAAGPPPGLLIFQGSSSAENALITNNGGPVASAGGATRFTDSATAANSTIVNQGGLVAGAQGGISYFLSGSTADQSTITLAGGVASVAAGGQMQLSDNATAANANISVLGGTVSGAFGGSLQFYFDATAGDATITIAGPTGGSSSGGSAFFYLTATAGNAFVTADSGTLGASDSTAIKFYDDSSGGAARIQLLHSGTLDLSAHNAPGMTIGSLEGAGSVRLGPNNLTVGTNRLSTTFSGVISGPGSLTKTGSGQLVLSGPNTYTGGTLIKQGRLLTFDTSGSLTVLRGTVDVDGGTFGGSGVVDGSVTVGGPNGRPSVLEPNTLRGGNFILQKNLKFNPGATLRPDFNSSAVNLGNYSFVFANSVTIGESVTFAIHDFGNQSFGLVNLPIIVNNGTAPIVGQFANLPEGGSITVGMNTFYATYHGNDGNDFVLTTVPP